MDKYMIAEEIGIISQGRMLVRAKSKFRKEFQKIDKALIGGFFSAIQTFNISFYNQKIEILSGKNYCIIFYFQDLAESLNNSPRDLKHKKDNDILLSYAVIKNTRKNIESYARRIVRPRLKKILIQFKHKYSDCNLSIISQFIDFKNILIKEFEVDLNVS